jgi:tetratricopeptide (TPR) repeat protein/predicted Ser/Thr protein kinase
VDDEPSGIANTAPADESGPRSDFEEDRVRAVVERRLLATTTVAPVKIGRFPVLRKLAQGGMGVVYSGFDEELDRRVAIKVLAGESREEATERLRREAQAMARLSHPNVVTIYEVGMWEGQVFLAMEFVRGKTLGEWLTETGPSWREILDVFRQAADGLAAAHEVGVVHRDFKPENVMIDDRGRVKVLDFGLAMTEESIDPVALSMANDREFVRPGTGGQPKLSLTMTGSLMGTPAYMAPEQHLGRPTDSRTDQFSFCVALYEALYDGQRPFGGDDRDSISDSVLGGNLRPPPKGSKVPGWIRKVLARGLATSPDQRWSSMGALVTQLNRDPARLRMQLGGLGIVLGAVLGVWGYTQLQEQQAVAACEQEGAQISKVWNDEAKAQVRDALLKTQVAHASETWAKVEQRIDDYVGEWSQNRTSVCNYALVHQEWTAEQHQSAARCFDARKTRLQAVVDVLSHASRGAAQEAIGLSTDLPDLATCTRAESFDRGTDLPTETTRREEVIEGTTELERANVLLAAGSYGDALDIAQTVLAAAGTNEYAPLRAQALQVAGLAYLDKADYDRAEKNLDKAYFLAVDEGIDSVAAVSASNLCVLVGYRLSRYEEGLRWAKHAQVIYDRLEGDDTGQAQLYNNLGLVHHRAGDFDASRTHHLRALQLRETIYDEAHPLVAESLFNLALVHRDMGAYAAAESAFQRAVEIQSEALGREHPRVAAALNGLGAFRIATGDYDAAEEHYSEALRIGEAAFEQNHPRLLGSISGLGVIHRERGEYEEARALFERVLQAHTDQVGGEHRYVAGVLTELALLNIEVGQLDRADELLGRAAEIRQRTQGRDHPDLAPILLAQGRIQLEQGHLTEAAEYYARTLGITERAFGADHRAVAAPLAGLGAVRVAQGQHDRAVEPLQRALGVLTTVPGDPREIAAVRFSLARALWDATETARARPRARTIAEQARTDYASAGAHASEERDAVETWLNEHSLE